MKKTILLFAILGCCNLWSQDGLLDTTFGANGIVSTHIPSSYSERAKAVCVQSDHKIVVGATVYPTVNSSNFCVLRYLPDGAPDNGFGTNGMIITSFPYSGQLEGLALSDGKIIAVGGTSDGTHSVVAIAKYNDDGSPDMTFGETAR